MIFLPFSVTDAKSHPPPPGASQIAGERLPLAEIADGAQGMAAFDPGFRAIRFSGPLPGRLA